MQIKKLTVVPTEERRQVSLRTVGLRLGEIWQLVAVLRIAIWQYKRRRVETG